MSLPTYHGFGAFGESLFVEEPPNMSEEELQELYPEVTKELSGFPDE